MTQIDFGFSEILEEVKLRLDYMSSKRASTPTDFFRLSLCEADASVLQELALEAAALLSEELGKISGGYDLRSGTLSFFIAIAEALPGEKRHLEISSLLKGALVYAVIFKWLLLAGSAEATVWREQMEFMVTKLRASSAVKMKLRSRPLFPL